MFTVFNMISAVELNQYDGLNELNMVYSLDYSPNIKLILFQVMFVQHVVVVHVVVLVVMVLVE